MEHIFEEYDSDDKYDSDFCYIQDARTLPLDFDGLKDSEFAGLKWKYQSFSKEGSAYHEGLAGCIESDDDIAITYNLANEMLLEKTKIEAKIVLKRFMKNDLFRDRHQELKAYDAFFYCLPESMVSIFCEWIDMNAAALTFEELCDYFRGEVLARLMRMCGKWPEMLQFIASRPIGRMQETVLRTNKFLTEISKHDKPNMELENPCNGQFNAPYTTSKFIDDVQNACIEHWAKILFISGKTWIVFDNDKLPYSAKQRFERYGIKMIPVRRGGVAPAVHTVADATLGFVLCAQIEEMKRGPMQIFISSVCRLSGKDRLEDIPVDIRRLLHVFIDRGYLTISVKDSTTDSITSFFSLLRKKNISFLGTLEKSSGSPLKFVEKFPANPTIIRRGGSGGRNTDVRGQVLVGMYGRRGQYSATSSEHELKVTALRNGKGKARGVTLGTNMKMFKEHVWVAEVTKGYRHGAPSNVERIEQGNDPAIVVAGGNNSPYTEAVANMEHGIWLLTQEQRTMDWFLMRCFRFTSSSAFYGVNFKTSCFLPPAMTEEHNRALEIAQLNPQKTIDPDKTIDGMQSNQIPTKNIAQGATGKGQNGRKADPTISGYYQKFKKDDLKGRCIDLGLLEFVPGQKVKKDELVGLLIDHELRKQNQGPGIAVGPSTLTSSLDDTDSSADVEDVGCHGESTVIGSNTVKNDDDDSDSSEDELERVRPSKRRLPNAPLSASCQEPVMKEAQATGRSLRYQKKAKVIVNSSAEEIEEEEEDEDDEYSEDDEDEEKEQGRANSDSSGSADVDMDVELDPRNGSILVDEEGNETPFDLETGRLQFLRLMVKTWFMSPFTEGQKTRAENPWFLGAANKENVLKHLPAFLRQTGQSKYQITRNSTSEYGLVCHREVPAAASSPDGVAGLEKVCAEDGSFAFISLCAIEIKSATTMNTQDRLDANSQTRQFWECEAGTPEFKEAVKNPPCRSQVIQHAAVLGLDYVLVVFANLNQIKQVVLVHVTEQQRMDWLRYFKGLSDCYLKFAHDVADHSEDVSGTNGKSTPIASKIPCLGPDRSPFYAYAVDHHTLDVCLKLWKCHSRDVYVHGPPPSWKRLIQAEGNIWNRFMGNIDLQRKYNNRMKTIHPKMKPLGLFWENMLDYAIFNGYHLYQLYLMRSELTKAHTWDTWTTKRSRTITFFDYVYEICAEQVGFSQTFSNCYRGIATSLQRQRYGPTTVATPPVPVRPSASADRDEGLRFPDKARNIMKLANENQQHKSRRLYKGQGGESPHVVGKLPTGSASKSCVVCCRGCDEDNGHGDHPDKAMRKRRYRQTSFYCQFCNVSLCKKAGTDCWNIFHNEQVIPVPQCCQKND